MSSVLERFRTRTTALAVLMIAGLWGCEGAGIGVSYSGYYEPYDYDYDYDYGPWGPDYYVGPPVIVGGVHGRDRARPRISGLRLLRARCLPSPHGRGRADAGRVLQRLRTTPSAPRS
jgi:hypothetical protein